MQPVDARQVELDRYSAVMMLGSDVLPLALDEYSVLVLPLPGRDRHEHHAKGRRIARSN